MSVKVGMKVINNEGVLALMKGSGVFSLKRVGDWVTRYYFATEIENIMFRRGDYKRRVKATFFFYLFAFYVANLSCALSDATMLARLLLVGWCFLLVVDR
jgi:hypothetical protein